VTADGLVELVDSLTEIEYDGKRFIARSAPRPAASLAIRAAGVALPPTVSLLIRHSENLHRSIYRL
jgi:hypothetical protein